MAKHSKNDSKPEQPSADPFDHQVVESVRIRLCRYLAKTYVTQIGSGKFAAGFVTGELTTNAEAGFVEAEKPTLRLVLDQLEDEGYISRGFIEMPTSSGLSDPWFTRSHGVEIRRTVLTIKVPQNKEILDSAPHQSMQKCHYRAYLAARYAEIKSGQDLTAEEAYEYWKEYGFDSSDDSENAADLRDYELPTTLETFKTYLAKGRRGMCDPRNDRRRGRTGGSIVHKDEIE